MVFSTLDVIPKAFYSPDYLIGGGVVKLVITSACHAEGRGFEPHRSRHFSPTLLASVHPNE